MAELKLPWTPFGSQVKELAEKAKDDPPGAFGPGYVLNPAVFGDSTQKKKGGKCLRPLDSLSRRTRSTATDTSRSSAPSATS